MAGRTRTTLQQYPLRSVMTESGGFHPGRSHTRFQLRHRFRALYRPPHDTGAGRSRATMPALRYPSNPPRPTDRNGRTGAPRQHLNTDHYLLCSLSRHTRCSPLRQTAGPRPLRTQPVWRTAGTGLGTKDVSESSSRNSNTRMASAVGCHRKQDTRRPQFVVSCSPDHVYNPICHA